MKITLERKNDPILRSPIYILTVGLHKYHYEKLTDVLLREAILFEPSQKEKKPRHTMKVSKKPKKFPLGDTILKILPKNDSPGIPMGDVIQLTKTPRSFSASIWGAVMGKLVKKGKVKSTIVKGINYYRRAK